MSFAQSVVKMHEEAVRVFGEEVQIPSGPIKAIFDDPADLTLLGRNQAKSGVPFTAEHPVLTMTLDEASALVEGNKVSVRGKDYGVSRILPDGLGLAEVELGPWSAPIEDSKWR